MKIENKIALKYIFGKKISFVSIINLLAIIGISLGVAALIFVISVLSGFQELNYNQIIGFDPHLSIKNFTDNSELEFIKNLKEVESVAITNENKVALRKDRSFKVARVKSIYSEFETYIEKVNNKVNLGRFSNEGNKIVIGHKLATEIDASLGDRIEIIKPENIEKSARLYRKIKGDKVIISGIFYSNVKDYDSKQIYRISNDLSSNSRLEILLVDYNNTDKVLNVIKKKFPGAEIKSWKEMNSDFYQIMKFEKTATFSVLFLIILISVFNLLASLSMTVIQKTKDISILRALGMMPAQIVSIYKREGLIIGLTGTTLGSLIGLTLVYLQETQGLLKFGKGITIQSAFPVNFEIHIFIVIIISTVILSYLSTIFPAKKSKNVDIIDGLRES